jgi:hypothetical protein
MPEPVEVLVVVDGISAHGIAGNADGGVVESGVRQSSYMWCECC